MATELLIDQLALDPAANTYRAYCREDGGEWEWREVSSEDAEALTDFFEQSLRDLGDFMAGRQR